MDPAKTSELENKSPRPASKPPIPEPAGDGFPLNDDVSTPPPGSDPVDGQHKEKE
jgi:hypothetical protein